MKDKFYTIILIFLITTLQSCIEPKGNSSSVSRENARDNRDDPPAGHSVNTSSNPPPPSQNVYLRAIHLSPDAPNVDIYVNNQLAISNLAYLSTTSHLPLGAANVNVKVNVVNTPTTVIDSEISLPSDFNTLIALNSVSNLEPILLSDDKDAPSFGSAKIRVVHGISNVGGVDVYALPSSSNCNNLQAQQPVLSSVPFKGASGYLTVSSGVYDICVATSGSSTAAIVADDLILSSQSVSTVIAVNQKNNFSSLGFFVIDDLGVNTPVTLFP